MLVTDEQLRRKGKSFFRNRRVQNICLVGIVVRRRHHVVSEKKQKRKRSSSVLSRDQGVDEVSSPGKKRRRIRRLSSSDDDDDEEDRVGERVLVSLVDDDDTLPEERGGKKEKLKTRRRRDRKLFLDEEAECTDSDDDEDDVERDDDEGSLDSFIDDDVSRAGDDEGVNFYRRLDNNSGQSITGDRVERRNEPADLNSGLKKFLLRQCEIVKRRTKEVRRRIVDAENPGIITADDEPSSSSTLMSNIDNQQVDYHNINSEDYTFRYLFRLDLSGEGKIVQNAVCKAVAVLSNSKRLFFDRVLTLLDCLDPRKSETLYTDTDSILMSLSSDSIEQCLRPEKLELWRERSILVDETSVLSQHGKLKVEGYFSGARFRALKMYRLYHDALTMDEPDSSKRDSSCKDETRCKGVSRRVAAQLTNSVFKTLTDNGEADGIPDQETGRDDVRFEKKNRTLVTRTSLQPTLAGEIVIVRQSKSMNGPYNFKRYVTSDGLHTLPLSLAPGTVSSLSSSSSSILLSRDEHRERQQQEEEEEDE